MCAKKKSILNSKRCIGCERAYVSLCEAAETDCGSADALQLLYVCSLLNPEHISGAFLELLTGFSRDRLNQGMARLLRFSLVQRPGEQKNRDKVLISRVTQDEVQYIMLGSDLSDFIEKIGTCLKRELFGMIPGTYAFWNKKELIMHAQWMLVEIGLESCLDNETDSFLHEIVGEYQLQFGNLKGAEEHLNQAVGKAGSGEAVHVLGCLSLAFLYEAERKYQEAQKVLYVVHSSEAMLAQDFPVHYFKLKLVEAYLHDDMEMQKETAYAVKEAEKQIEKCRSKLSPDEMLEHQMELTNIKGHVFSLQGNESDAEKQYEEVIAMWDEQAGKNKGGVLVYAYACINLAGIRTMSSGDNGEAISYLQKGGEILRELYNGADHPDLAMQMTFLGRSYMNQGGECNEEKACQYFTEAYDMLVCRMGLKEHSFGAQICLWQAMLAWRRKRFKDVCCYCSQGLAIAERTPASEKRNSLICPLLFYKIFALYQIGEYKRFSQIWLASKPFLAEMRWKEAFSMRCKIWAFQSIARVVRVLAVFKGKNK